MQHRAARRAKARRQKIDYWTKLAPVVVYLASVIGHIDRAHIKRVGDVFGGYIRDRLNEKSLSELLFPVLPMGELLPAGPSEYEIEDGVVTFYRNEVPFMWMDEETFDALRREPEIEQ